MNSKQPEQYEWACPCCGHVNTGVVPTELLPAVTTVDGHALHILQLLVSMPGSCTSAFFIDKLWADDPDGGPMDPHTCFMVHKNRLKKYIEPCGWTVVQDYRRGPYRLSRVVAEGSEQHVKRKVG